MFTDLMETERGNILLTNTEANMMQAYIKVGENVWLAISWIPDDYPSLTVWTMSKTKEELKEYILTHHSSGDWVARKMNIDIELDQETDTIPAKNN